MRTRLVILSSAERMNWIATTQGFLFDEVFEFIVTKRREKLPDTRDYRRLLIAADFTLSFLDWIDSLVLRFWLVKKSLIKTQVKVIISTV